MMKAADFNKNAALPTKVRELIGLAVAAQIPCQYCVYYHIKSAKAAGASEEEMRELEYINFYPADPTSPVISSA
jgi:AhpD family alkylhydroperoxidase